MSSSSDTKPRVLILGGTGFVGRHLVKYIVTNNLALKVRVADKALPVTSYMNKEFSEIFQNPIVEFKQANLANPVHVKKVFTDDQKYDYVVNLAAETRYGQTEEVYDEMVYKVSINCAKEALAMGGVKKYIETSTAFVYDSSSKPCKENAKLKPWTLQAKKKLKVEEEISKMGLPLIIIRPAIIYGPADVNGLAPRIIVAATYKHTKEKMKLLWSGDLRINTVHVTDVVRAIWHLLVNGAPGKIYNLADKHDTSQKKLNDILGDVFGIETGFLGTAISAIASAKLTAVVNTANDNHMGPWSDMCKEKNIKFTPLSPYLDKELLYNNNLYIDGSAIEETGFKYEHPNLTKEAIIEEIKYYVDLNLFPAVIDLK